MNNDIKEFHLLAEPVVREMSPSVKAHLWGYNGQSPRPMIDVVKGDRVRVFVTNKLPEHTSVNRHGQRLPNGMADMAAMEMPTPARLQSEGGQTTPVMNMPAREVEVQVRKPMGHSGH